VGCQVGCAAMAEDDVVVGESRWPMACAVATAIALTVLVRHSVRASPHPVFPVIEGVLLLVLIVGDPGRIDRRTRWLRIASIALAVQSTISLVILGLVVARAVNVFT